MINKDFIFYEKFKYTFLKKSINKNNSTITIAMLIFILILLIMVLINTFVGKKIFQNNINYMKSKNSKITTDSIPKQPKEKWKYIYKLKNDE
ncbi:MAG: hypothetical protein UAT33_02720 [Buchnera aphidicola (Floraphis choui)]